MTRITNKDSAEKVIIELSATPEEADGYVQEFSGKSDIKGKLVYIQKTFDIQVLGAASTESEEIKLENDYWAMLTVIVNKKWR